MDKHTYQTYVHLRVDTGQVFYVGAGNESRPFDKRSRTKEWKQVADKGYAVELCAKWDTPQEAESHEIFLINLFRGIGQPLVNKYARCGFVGYKHTSESLEKMSIANKGENHPFFGKPSTMLGRKLSPESRAKVSAAMSGEKNPWFGKPGFMTGRAITDEHRAKLSASRSGSKNHNFGKKMSDEQKAKLSAARKTYLANKAAEEANQTTGSLS